MSIIDRASLVITPTAYKEDKLYSIVPKDGSGDLVWTRVTEGTRINKNGFIERTPYNLMSYSEQFNVPQWVKLISGTGILPVVEENVGIDPLGYQTADKITFDRGAGNFSSDYSLMYGAVNIGRSIYTMSFYIKAFSAADVGKTIVARSTAANIYRTVTLTSEWQRVVATSVSISNQSSNSIDFYNRGGETTGGSTSIYLWGVQLVEGTEPKEYFPTANRQDVPRITYPTTGGTPSLLIEPQRTNLVTNSSILTNWTKTRVNVIEAIDINSPMTGYLAYKLIPSSEVGTKLLVNSVPAQTSGTTVSLSLYVKKAELNGVYLYLNDSSSRTIFFNLDTEFLGGSISNRGFEKLNDGWYRIFFTYTLDANSSSILISTYMDNPTVSYVGNDSDGVYICLPQYEVGSNVTSIIPTTTAAVTRNADSIQKTNISDLIGQTEGTVYVDFNYQKNDPGENFIVTLSDNSRNNGVWLYINSSNNFVAIIRAGGSSAISFSLSAANFQFGRKKIAFSYKSGATSLYVNGAKIGLTNTNAFTFNNTVSKLNLGCFWSNDLQLNNTINSSAIFKQSLTDAECIALTTL